MNAGFLPPRSRTGFDWLCSEWTKGAVKHSTDPGSSKTVIGNPYVVVLDHNEMARFDCFVTGATIKEVWACGSPAAYASRVDTAIPYHNIPETRRTEAS